MSLMVGRISYLPDDNRLRNVRIQAEKKSLYSLKSLLPESVKIIKIAQNYKDNELDDIEDIREYSKLGVSKARNIILNEFYESDFDYLLLLDDDNTFYPYYHIDEFLSQVNDNSYKFLDYGIFMARAIEPQYSAFKKDNLKLNCEDNFVFKQACLSDGTGLFLIANLDKLKGIKLFFDEKIKISSDIDSENEVIDFIIRFTRIGLTCFQCRNMIQKNTITGRKGQAVSTVFDSSENVDKSYWQITRNTARRYNIPMDGRRIKWSKGIQYFKGYLSISRSGK
jgi:hypothetical protein